MKSVRGTAENTLEYPTTVYPVSKRISLEGTAPQFCVPPFSLNILRIKQKK